MLCGVTGANGFVGSHMVDHLLREGHQVRVLVRPTADLRWIRDPVVEVVQGSVSEREALCRTFDGCDLVFHIAGVTSAHVPEEFYRVNRDGTRRAVAACLEAAPRARRFVLMSSIAAVGPGSKGAAIDEAAGPHPINHYGRSKLAGEEQARAVGDRLPLTIVRPGAIYGPRDRDVLTLLKVATLGFRVHVGLARRELNFCHVGDVVQGTLLAASRDEGRGETFNIGDINNYQLSEVGQTMARVMGRQSTLPVWLPLSLAYGVGAAGGVVSRLRRTRPKLNLDRIRLLTARNWKMDVGKARRLLGFSPRHTLEAGLEETVAWYRRNGWLG
jgi:nucleoside-diphosphate-sugar epimerase